MGSAESDFVEALTGSALVSALETQELLNSVGYRRLRRPRFEVPRLSSQSSLVCMDLSGVAIVNAEGEQVETTRVDRLVAAIEGQVSKEELDADLACAADAVAIMEACYTSNKTGGWVDFASI